MITDLRRSIIPGTRVAQPGTRLAKLPFLLIILSILVTACGERPNGGGDGSQPIPLVPQVSESPAPVTSTQETTRISDSTALALEGEGLRIFDVSSGAARPLPFGSPLGEVVEILTRVQEMAPSEKGESADCGVEYVTWESGLTVLSSSGRFQGWSARERSRGLTTVSGIGIGSTREELEDVYAIEVDSTSLGIEFTAGGLAGVLDSAEREGRVIALWAGVVCLAR